MNAIRLCLRESWRVAPWPMLMTSAEVLARLLQVLQPVVVGMIIGGLVGGDRQQVVSWTIALIVAFGLGEGFGAIGLHARVRLMETLGHAFDLRVARLLAEIPTVEHHSDPEVAERLRLLDEEAGSMGLGANRLLNVLLNGVYVVGCAVVAVTASWWMLLPLAASASALLTAPHIARIEAAAETGSAPFGIHREELLDVVTDPAAAVDARVHGGNQLLRERLSEASFGWTIRRQRAAERSALLAGLDRLVFLLAAGVALFQMLREVSNGSLGAGAFSQGFLLVTNLAGLTVVTKFTLALAARAVRSFDRCVWLENFARRESAALGELHTAHEPVADGFANAVDLRDVSFRYPGAESDALRPTTLGIPAGSLVAIVGVNGSGKTTLANLILGLLTPTSGHIAVGGEDPRRHAAGGVAQDYVRYQLRIRDNIGFGDLDGIDDDARLIDAATLAGADQFVDLEVLDHILGNQWTEGRDLSGGQWQRLALSRGLLGRRHVTLFDEPTAALDVHAERKLVGVLREDVGTDDGPRTRVVITHRLDVIDDVDIVIVMHDGAVVQHGSPVDLARQHGRFAELLGLHRRLVGLSGDSIADRPAD